MASYQKLQYGRRFTGQEGTNQIYDGSHNHGELFLVDGSRAWLNLLPINVNNHIKLANTLYPTALHVV